MLGLTAPFSGSLSDRLGARVLSASGMAICVAAVVLLYAVLDGSSASLPAVMLALAAVGVGQGMFTSPNSNSIMAAAPERLAGEAGSLMNVMRACGMSVGIAASSALLSWQLEMQTGRFVGTIGVAPDALIGASRTVLLLLAALAAVAAVISLVRPQR
jgi:MFS family permease